MSAPGGKREDSFYLAPMEGVTGYVYRNACHACFHPLYLAKERAEHEHQGEK